MRTCQDSNNSTLFANYATVNTFDCKRKLFTYLIHLTVLLYAKETASREWYLEATSVGTDFGAFSGVFLSCPQSPWASHEAGITSSCVGWQCRQAP